MARGYLSARKQIANALRAAPPTSAADLIAALPGILFRSLDAEGLSRGPEVAALIATELHVVYFCPDRARAAGVMLSSTRLGLPNWYEPFTCLPVTEATSPGVEIATALGRDVDATDPSSFDAARDGRLVAEAQRRSTWSFNGVPAGHHAAGAVDLTTVDEHGVRTRAIQHWRDQRGKRVRPEGAQR